MDQQSEAAVPPAAWIEAVESGEADFLAGRVTPATDVLAELRAMNERMMTCATKKATDAA